MSDLELLRRYEPIVRYTRGEMFFPAAVDEYVRACSLWMRDASNQTHLIVPKGELDVDKLGALKDAPPGSRLYLQFVEAPMTGLEYQQWFSQSELKEFKAPGRLARVPLISRIGDSLFSLSFFIRGTVPGGTTATADQYYQAMRRRDPRRVYYGRVIREAGWTALQYLFFFPMNPWRSGYYGVNDHEADWEQVFIFLFDDGDGVERPVWVAFASHDFKGDDLRRRWDDPLLTKVGNHPVIFAGAGSHASYFEQGEYVMSFEPGFLKPVRQLAEAALKVWYDVLGQGNSEEERRALSALSVPFVDYARGDGLAVGPGQDEEWTPIPIADADPWVNNYRGLWGLDTRDLFGGERAPAGPKYDRDATIRMSWNDPLGWAGLDKIFPPAEIAPRVQQRVSDLEDECDELSKVIDETRTTVRDLQLDVEALANSETAVSVLEEREKRLNEEQRKLQDLHRRRSQLKETIAALQEHGDRLGQGDYGSPTAHLKHAHHPTPPPPPQSRAVEVWAALSGALALLAVIALVVVQPPHWGWLLLGALLFIGAIEAVTRQRLLDYLITAVVGLAIAATAILVFEFWRWVILLLVVGVVIFMIRDNLRELRSG